MTLPGMQRLTEAYTSDATAARAEQRQAAGRFQPDLAMERLALLKMSAPEQYERLSPSEKVSLGYYLSDKAAWQAANPGAFVPDPELERLIAVRASDPVAYFGLSADVRQSVDQYVARKARAETTEDEAQEGNDEDPGYRDDAA